MGQKVNPTGYRAGIHRDWASRWYAGKKDFGAKFGQDYKIRAYFEKKFQDAGVSSVRIERDAKNIRVIVTTAKVGVLVGRGGEKAEAMEKEISRMIGTPITLEVTEVANPDTDAVVVAEGVCRQLERRMPFRRVAKMAVQKALEAGAKGAKVSVGGRLGGVDIARSEFFSDGSVPLQTIRADISYAMDRAETTYGTLGVKVWIYRGEKFKAKKQELGEA
nr:ribosomal protein S3 [uncultured bacterium]